LAWLPGAQGARVKGEDIGLEGRGGEDRDGEGSVLGPVPTPDTSGVEFGWPGCLGEQGARVKGEDIGLEGR
jgi:hypothetical protein